MLGYTIASPLMMRLGPFTFGTYTAAYQELNRSTEWKWAEQELFGQGPAMQFTGPGPETMQLPGVIYPEFRAGVGQLDDMRAAASLGQPLLMVSGLGRVLGRWVIDKIDEKQSVFASGAVPRKQEFTVSLRRYFGVYDGVPLAALPGASGTIRQVAGLFGL